jgi:membrane associated rhomboid family serine protease
VYRLNTYPVIHSGFFHAFLNVLALTPLLERFEAEHGTLTAVALFVGRRWVLPFAVPMLMCRVSQRCRPSRLACIFWLRSLSCIATRLWLGQGWLISPRER